MFLQGGKLTVRTTHTAASPHSRLILLFCALGNIKTCLVTRTVEAIGPGLAQVSHSYGRHTFSEAVASLVPLASKARAAKGLS